MASPFSIFRRNKRVSLAVLGVVVMIGFVVLPAIIQMQQFANSSSNNGVVLKWKGGKLTENEIASKRHTRNALRKFVQKLQEDALKKDPDVQLSRAVGIPNTDDPRSIVQTVLLADKARKMGIVVSDQAISDFLSSVTDGVLTPSELVTAKKDVLGTKWTEEMLFDALREELLAQKVRQMAFTPSLVTTPAAAWEYHNRMERQVTAEFVPFPVADYLKDVTTEPTNKEVQDLYEKYKADYPMPDSPEPGFKARPKAQFEYFVADYDKFLQEEKLKVTDEQIKQYYEENKNSFRIDEPPADEVDNVDPDDPRQAKPIPPVPPSGEAAEEAETESEAPAEPANDEPASEETPATPAGEGEPGAQGEAGEAGQAATEDAPAEDAPAEDAPAEESPAEEKPADDQPATDPPATDDAAEKPKVELPPVDAGDGEPEKPATGDTIPGDDDLTAPPEKEPKYKPLDEVKDEIRRQLASAPAEKRLAAAMDEARKALREFRDARVLHQTDPDYSPDPGKFDYQAVAKKLGLETGETKMVDALDMYNDKDLELGQSYTYSDDFSSGGRPQEIPFAATALQDSTRLYYPIETQLRGREKVFLSWKTDEQKAEIPELSAIREKVVAAWKELQARKLAKAAAEKLAGEVSGKKPLKEQVDGKLKVLTPPPFTYYQPLSLWMFRLQGQQPQWEEIQGVEDGSSDAVKKKVLAMPVGGVEVAENAAKSVYYVVRVAGDEGDDDRRKAFMQSIVDSQIDGPPPEVQMIARDDKLALFQGWNEQIDKEFGVEWLDKEYLERSMRGE